MQLAEPLQHRGAFPAQPALLLKTHGEVKNIPFKAPHRLLNHEKCGHIEQKAALSQFMDGSLRHFCGQQFCVELSAHRYCLVGTPGWIKSIHHPAASHKLVDVLKECTEPKAPSTEQSLTLLIGASSYIVSVRLLATCADQFAG